MSSPEQELGLIREFRELHSYVSRLGQQFNLIYKRLESLETQLNQISVKFDESTAVNRSEIAIIQQKMFTKSEFEEFVSELQITVDEKLPPFSFNDLMRFEYSTYTAINNSFHILHQCTLDPTHPNRNTHHLSTQLIVNKF